MDINNVLKLFKDYFTYPVPLGVCLSVAIVVLFLFMRLQTNRRKDYKLTFDQQYKINESSIESIKQKDKRIEELEKQLDSLYKNKKEGK